MEKYYIPKFSEQEIKNVKENLSPNTSKACNNNIMWAPSQKSYSGNYYGHSLKRSNLKDCTFDGAVFDHTSFAGSVLENIVFKNNCKVDSMYMEKSTLIDVSFEKGMYINASNFSYSHLSKLKFSNCELRSTYFNNCYMENCVFDKCLIRSTMFGDSILNNCSFLGCNMRNLNIEFCTMSNCVLDDTCFSYFQLPYIIGVFKDLKKLNKIYVGRNNNNPIPFSEYYRDIKESIIYFTSLEEYFPMSNLYYAINEMEIAYSCIMTGIEKAINRNDIFSVKQFCKLGQFYDILKISDIQLILKKIDNFLEKNKHKSIYPILLKQSYEMKSEIYQNKAKDKLEIVINTSLTENNFDKVNEICDDIDTIICTFMPTQITTTYQISHNSPFEICVNCVGLAADLLAISGLIYSYISKRLSKKSKINPVTKKYIQQNNEAYLKSLNNQFDYFSQILEKTSKQKQSKVIEEFRGKIISSATEQLNKDYSLIISKKDDE